VRLIHRHDRERLGISLRNIESPFFAKSAVQEVFAGRSLRSIDGLKVWTHGQAWSDQKILDAVGEGDLLLVSDDPFDPLSSDTSGRYWFITEDSGFFGGLQRPAAQGVSTRPPAEPWVKPPPQEPGFYVVPKSTTAEQLKATLFATQNPSVMRKFEALNPGLGEVKAGTMIVLSDPHNLQCTHEEALLTEAAAKTNSALEVLSPQEADFMVRHRHEIETFLAEGSTAIGVGEAIFSSNLKNMQVLLKDIEALHVRTFNAHGHLRSPEFFAERKRLLNQLNTHLTALSRKGIGLPDHPNLKNALGISSRSLVHRWTKAGAAGQIPGYATHIEGVAKAAKVVKYGGWVGTAIGGGASYMKVQDVCAEGDAEACRKIKFTETGSFTGGVIGGTLAGGLLGSSAAGTVCVALGVPTLGTGTLVCGVVVVGVASLATSILTNWGGEYIGEIIYEHSR
jgi:hypothetical protein